MPWRHHTCSRHTHDAIPPPSVLKWIVFINQKIYMYSPENGVVVQYIPWNMYKVYIGLWTQTLLGCVIGTDWVSAREATPEIMVTSSNGKKIRVTDALWGESTGHRWIPLTKASDAELWCFLWSVPEKNGWANNRDAGDLRRHRAHHDVTVMYRQYQTTTNYDKARIACQGWLYAWAQPMKDFVTK